MFDGIRKQISGKSEIESSINSILTQAEDSYSSDSIFDFCKSIVEGICRTILTDKEIVFNNNTDLPALCKLTANSLLLTFSSEVEVNSARKIIGGYVTIIHGVCELRNEFGAISHGRDFRSISSIEEIRNFIVSQTDSIGEFFLKIHFNNIAVDQHRLYYSDYKDFNDIFDGELEILRIGNNEYLPSYVLFNTDIEAYRSELIKYKEGI